MTETVDISEAFQKVRLRQEATEMVVHLLINTLERNRLLEKGDFFEKLQRLAELIEQDARPNADELSSLLRTIYCGEQGTAEILDFPDGKS
jgi:hypothetical protein